MASCRVWGPRKARFHNAKSHAHSWLSYSAERLPRSGEARCGAAEANSILIEDGTSDTVIFCREQSDPTVWANAGCHTGSTPDRR